MMVNAMRAYEFVNSHDPIRAQLYIEDGIPKKLFILSEAVDMAGNVSIETDIVNCRDGMVDLGTVRDILGY